MSQIILRCTINDKCLFSLWVSFIVLLSVNNTKKPFILKDCSSDQWIINKPNSCIRFSEQFLLQTYFSHLNVLWEAFIEICFTMCQMATTLNTNKIMLDGTITAQLSFIWWKWHFLVLFYEGTHTKYCNKNASLQKKTII